MLTVLALIVPVVLLLLFHAVVKHALRDVPPQTADMAPTRVISSAEKVQSIAPADRRAA